MNAKSKIHNSDNYQLVENYENSSVTFLLFSFINIFILNRKFKKSFKFCFSNRLSDLCKLCKASLFWFTFIQKFLKMTQTVLLNKIY